VRAWILVQIFAVPFARACIPANGAPVVSGPTTLIDRKAPEFARKDLGGRILDLRSFRGKVVLLNFWATWCAPCLTEMPVFNSWQRQYGPQGMQVIGISMDDDSTPVRKLVTKLKPEYPVAMGDARLGERYGGVLGLPLTYLVDRNGIVRAQFQGEINLDIIETRLKMALAQR
jgi:cytochrome c biogenesis protein CcmG, thiol:disulfide interchange protein DsbE